MASFPSLLACLCALLTVAFPGPGEALTFGAISDNTRQEYARHDAFLKLVESRYEEAGIEVDLKVFDDFDVLSEALADGDVDVVMDSPMVIAHIVAHSGAIPMVRRWKDGVSTYRSVIFAEADSSIDTLKDLRGRRIGFEERASSSGFMLPMSMILAEGIEPLHDTTRTRTPRAEQVAYTFTGADRNTLIWMIKGRIDAAGTTEQHFRQLEQLQPGRFKIIAQSLEVPRNIVVRSPAMSEEAADELAAILISLDESEDGRQALNLFDRTTRFDPLPEDFERVLVRVTQILSALKAADILDQ